MKPKPKSHLPAPPAVERLYTCPRCSRSGFTGRGLLAHHCRAKSHRARLTPWEVSNALAEAQSRGAVT